MAYIGYARVSTLDQDPALQVDALAAVECSNVFEDRASGVKRALTEPGSVPHSAGWRLMTAMPATPTSRNSTEAGSGT